VKAVVASVIAVLTALTIAALAAQRGGSGVRSGGSLVSDYWERRAVYNPRAQPVLAESLALVNSGARRLVVDGVRVGGATPGLHVVGACVAWHSNRVTQTGTGDFLVAGCNKRPRAQGTAVAPGRIFSLELVLQFSGRSEKWTYQSVEVAYHVGHVRYVRTWRVENRYFICRKRSCVGAVLKQPR
jgi:hypothetical protein